MKRLMLIPLFALLFGCSSVKRPFEGRHDPYPASQVNFASQHLQDATAIGSINASRDAENNILYVSVSLRSATNEQLYIDYRVTFFDRNNQVISNSGWFTRTLTPNVPTDIEVRSSSPRAADFRIDFRDAK